MSVFVLAFISSFLFYLNAQKDVHVDWRKRIALFPLFIAGSMGFAYNNSRAVIEGLLSRKSEFVRTPKYKIVEKNDKFENTSYFKKSKIDTSTYVELLLAVYTFVGVVASIYFAEIAALPFHIMFCFGFSTVSIMSLRQSYLKNKKVKK